MKVQLAAGFSIIEFMIAITIGALLIASVGSVYLSNKSTYLVQEGLARLQENGRFANYLLSREIRMAGFQGCANQKQTTINNLLKNTSSQLAFDTPLRGFDGNATSFSPALPANLSGKAVNGNDVIEIRMASTSNVHLSNDMNQAYNTVPVHAGLSIQPGNALMITNCLVGDMFIASAGTTNTLITHTTTNNTSASFSLPYTENAQVMQLFYYAYYIKNTGRLNSQNQNILALVRQDRNGQEEEIAEGVEQLKITYGVDTDSDNNADSYQTATQVDVAGNWNNVVSVQINLLMATINDVSDKIQPYVFNGVTITPADRKLRRQWDTFITLRNRGLPT